jgi:phage tail-like protein
MNSTLPCAFYFSVNCGGGSRNADTSFQEVGGIGPQIETESVTEGGENRFTHNLPKAVKHPRLSLKRGIAASDSDLVKWCQRVLEGGLSQRIDLRLVQVSLLDADGNPLRRWSFDSAYPVQWEIESFNSTKNELALEKIEICYAFSKREL